MFYFIVSTRRVAMLAALIAAFGMTGSAFAQRDAGSKARGEFGNYWSTQSSGRSIRHATEYNADLHQYLTAEPNVDPAYIKKQSAEIGRNLEAAKKDIANVKKDVPAGDKEAAAQVTKVEQHLATAAEKHEQLHQCCKKDGMDVKGAATCCKEMMDALKAVQAEHDALVKKLNPTAPPAVQK